MISLAQPALLLVGFLLLLPYVLPRQRAWHYSCVQLLQGARRLSLVTWLTYVATCAGISLLVIALANPQKVVQQSQETIEARDILLTLDLSLSMEAPLHWQQGGGPTKLEMVQAAALQFVKQHQHDRLGLVVFGDKAFGAWPLSTDSTMLQKRLQSLKHLLPTELRGTHIARALETSLDHFDQFEHTSSKILLLLTDGLDAIDAAVQERLIWRLNKGRIKLYVLGMQLADTTAIVQLAQRVHGGYFNINKANELAQALRQIDQQEAGRITISHSTQRRYLYPIFALAGLVLLFASTVSTLTWVWEV
jgi:Ca-activated chloride channel family protein